VALNVFGKLRCHNFGTFTITSVASEGAGIVVLTPLLTSTLHYGLFDERGNLNMSITFDHRVTDGAVVARSLVDVEEVLLGEILQELQPLRVFKAA
jgi:pyruvate/2-oxoglutarate dehydrogenase complex dihydrolipoamide acyltransferase (E2) component